MKRACAICGSIRKDKIHTQKYLLPGKRNLIAYDVVACRRCGFLFADNIPAQRDYDRYYKSSAKYTYNRNVPSGLQKIYQDIYAIAGHLIKKNKPAAMGKNSAILDAGCSIGSFLNMFKEHGFRNLTGIEPSANCSRLARELYGIDVFPGLLSEYKPGRKFDFIVMTGVLEHIADFDKVLPYVSKLLADSGMLMIVVPDAERFSARPRSPFDEFSIEHINYFTGTSLSNLMKRYNFINSFSKSLKATFYDSRCLVSFFKKSAEPGPWKKDGNGIVRMQSYIDACNGKLDWLDEKFERFIRSRQNFIVWGVGSLTYRLLATTNLSKMNISAFVDSNKSLQGKKVRNVRIDSPDYFNNITAGTVFVASHIYGGEIERILRNQYQFTGTVIRM
jgi:SAM-dependent methyltransferase